MSTALVDSHCHLPMIDLAEHDGSLDRVLAGAAEAGVGHMLCVSVDLESFPQVLATARRYDNVFASVGIHPNSPPGDAVAPETLAGLAADPRVVAIGETGLDYFRSEGDLDWQHERFRSHIRAARLAGKPLIIHTRDARADTLRLLREESAEQAGGVMHCFTEDWDTAARAMDLGFYISFSGIVTFRNAQALQEVARRVPAERLLVETDAPYLAPVPLRGRQNQPAYVRQVAEFLARLRGEELEALIARTTENFFRLFRSAVPVN